MLDRKEMKSKSKEQSKQDPNHLLDPTLNESPLNLFYRKKKKKRKIKS